jgi:hypothetical protein
LRTDLSVITDRPAGTHRSLEPLRSLIDYGTQCGIRDLRIPLRALRIENPHIGASGRFVSVDLIAEPVGERVVSQQNAADDCYA